MKQVLNLKRGIFLFLVVAIVLICSKISALEQISYEEKLNSMIDIDTDIYVQHDSNNKDIYLLSKEGTETTIYKMINVTYTASKQWTRDGLYIDDLTHKVGATAPDDYISVQEQEVYFVRLYGIGDIYTGVNGNEWHITAPIVYFDDEGNCVGYALSSTASSSKSGVEITIPKGATKMYISNYNNQEITIQKKLTVNEEEFNKIKEKQDRILNYVNTNYENIESDPIIYKELDKGYITFVNDDSRPSVDQFADLFIAKNVPLCFAAVADNLLNTASNLTETRLDVALRVQKAGGEILAHNAPVITASTITDNNFMYNYFVVQKQRLMSMGLHVNGIILAGGMGQITGSKTTAKWTSALYQYSDLLGEKQNTTLGIDSVYYHQRGGLGSYNNDIEKIKAAIDQTIEDKSWTVFYFHDTNEVSLETLNAVLDYINSKNKSDIQVATYNTMYQKFATRESSVKNDKKTYYVSSNGTSKDGTNENDPINLETLNKKKIKTGDTILLKSGDTFFGTLNLSITEVDNKEIKISSYGEGDLPTISTYKYISNSWEKYNDHIYRIDIKDTSHYTGYTSDSPFAFNVGFLEDDDGKKYYNKKVSIDALNNTYDFYSDGSRYLYMYIEKDPYKALGNLKVVVRSNLMTLSSHMKVSNIRFAYTAGHAIEGANPQEENIEITNCIIENIGGSYLYSSNLTNDTRYGNGIEFYGSNAKNIIITNNIFRNIYDASFTIQGPSGSGTNVDVSNNVFINNSQDSEIWESGSATGVYNYQFSNNLSINQGRGWGYEARTDKYPAASILFWGYQIDNTDILFSNNTFYNPRQIYYLSNETDKYFLSHDTIKSDHNIYYMAKDTTIYRNKWNYDTRKEFISTYQIDKNSTYNLITPESSLALQASTLNNINQIRLLVLKKETVIKSVELENVPSILKIEKKKPINLENLYLKINYLDGLSDHLKLDTSMLSDINYETSDIQTIMVSYLGYITTMKVVVEETQVQEQPTESNEIEKRKEQEENSTNTQVIEKKNTNSKQQEKSISISEDKINQIDEMKEESVVEDKIEEIDSKDMKTSSKEKNNEIRIKFIIGFIIILLFAILISVASFYKKHKKRFH